MSSEGAHGKERTPPIEGLVPPEASGRSSPCYAMLSIMHYNPLMHLRDPDSASEELNCFTEEVLRAVFRTKSRPQLFILRRDQRARLGAQVRAQVHVRAAETECMAGPGPKRVHREARAYRSEEHVEAGAQTSLRTLDDRRGCGQQALLLHDWQRRFQRHDGGGMGDDVNGRAGRPRL